MNRQELHVHAQQCMLKTGPIGEAWFYVYELTSDENASLPLLKTRLLRAANDLQINSAKRKFYQDTADSLNSEGEGKEMSIERELRHNLEEAQAGLMQEFQDHQKTKQQLLEKEGVIRQFEEQLRQDIDRIIGRHKGEGK